MADEREQAEQEVAQARQNMLEATGRMRQEVEQTPQVPAPMKKWRVKMKDGTVYRSVMAPTRGEAESKMSEGPQGPLAPTWGGPAAPLTPPPFKPATPPGREEPVLPEVARGVGTLAGGPAIGAASLMGEVVAPSPPSVTGREVAGSLVPLGVGALVRPARTLGSFLKTLGANVGGRATVEGGIEAAKPEGDILSGVVSGAAKGVLPGLAQAGAGAILGPTADTLRVQRAAQAVKRGVSPEVGALIDPSKPAQLLSGKTVKGMQKAAGANLDEMEATIEKALGPNVRFQIEGQAGTTPKLFSAQGTPITGGLPPELMARITGQPQGKTFGEIRAQIKELRGLGDRRYGSPEMADTARAALRDAQKLEAELVRQLPGPLATQYQAALARHATDSQAIRWVKGLQQENAIRGGVNPQDNPALAAANIAVERGGGKLKGAIHGALGAAEVATGRPIGAGYHLGRAADVSKIGPLRPGGSVPNLIPRVAGAGAGTGTSAIQDWLMRSILGSQPRLPQVTST